MNATFLAAELERDEGLRLLPYKDSVGKTTIGIGRNLDDVGISEAEARAMLAADIARVEADLDRELTWWRKLDEDRQRVLANMAFNLGVAKLLTFKNTLGSIFVGDYQAAADAMLASKWASQVGPRATRLAARMRGEVTIA